MLTTILDRRGTCIGFPYSNCFWSAGHDLGRVALVESAGHAFTSICSPQWRQTRTRRPVSSVAWAIRVGLPQFGQTSMTRLIGSGWAISRMPPCCIFGTRSFVPARLARLGVALGDVEALDDDARRHRPTEPRRKTLRAELGAGWRRMTRSTVPRLPASLPARTTTVSPLRISGTLGLRGWASGRPSQHLRGERDDLHVVAVAQLARDRAEDARPARVALVVDQDRGVLVEADVAAVRRGRIPWPSGR